MRGTVFALLHMVGFAHHRDVQAPQTTGGISPLIRLIRRVLPHAPDKHQPHQAVIARKTRRIIVRTARSRAVAIMRAAERDCEPRINHVSFGADNVSRRPWSESMMVGVDGGSIASPRPMSASRNTYRVSSRQRGHPALPSPYLAYSNFGNAFSVSLVAPGRINLPPWILSCPAGIATSCRSIPRKPPTPMIA
jgi:hypothetical protein